MHPSAGLGIPSWMFWLTDRAAGHSFWVAAIVGLVLSPGVMYLLALNEGRWLHWRDQFRAFMPGDILLGVAFGAVVYLLPHVPRSGQHFYHQSWWWWLPLGVALAFTLALNVMDTLGAPKHNLPGMADKTYSWQQMCSPTKVWHNVVVYFLYIYLFAAVGTPAVFAAQGGVEVLLARVVFGLSLAGWLFGLVWDAGHPKHSRAHVPATQRSWVISTLTIAALSACFVLAA